MNKFFTGFVVLLAVGLACCDSPTAPSADSDQAAQDPAPAADVAAVEAPPLIDRDLLFGNPLRYQGRR